ncbi:MAG: glycosyltransferase family 2 protein [Clostridia bacterium]|nr:glycosyltransferase family 2 protein [Clostridia bacterium]
MFLTALIPAFNEEANIGLTIQGLQKIEEVKQIIVVDDGCSDNTALIAKKMGVQVISHRVNKGKGHALNTGAPFVQGDYVALVDADLRETVQEIRKLIAPVIQGECDMAIAVFPPARKKGGMGLVKGAAFWGLKLLTRREFKAPLSGQRVMSRKVFLSLLPFASGFGVEVGMTIDAWLNGYRLMEVETQMKHEETGRDLAGFLHRGVQFKDVFLTLTKKGWRRWALS